MEIVKNVKTALGKRKKLTVILSSVSVLFLGAGLYFYQDYKEKKHLEEVKAASEQNQQLVADMIEVGADAEDILNVVSDTWHDSIFVDWYTIDGQYAGNFNTALKLRYEQFNEEGLIVSLESQMDAIEKEMEDLDKQPKEVKGDYELVYNMYKELRPFVDLAISPDGSLQTFNAKFGELQDNIIAAHDDYKMKGSDPKEFEEE